MAPGTLSFELSKLNPVFHSFSARKRRAGVVFQYDVRTTLNIVNCVFVWKNGNYDAVLASGTPNREDLLYLSLIDGRVELISGIGRPMLELDGYNKNSHASVMNVYCNLLFTHALTFFIN